jgi:hypothetical protein
MSENWVSLDVRFGQPGSEREIAARGLLVHARLDTGADVSVVPPRLVEQIYGSSDYPKSPVTIQLVSGTAVHYRVPLLVSLHLDSGEAIHSQVECLVAPLDAVLIGNDVLSTLALNVRLDYKERRVVLERYTWRRFEEEVAAAYRALGASVRANLNLAGFQIDLLVQEETQSRQKIRLAVECKFYKEPIGNRVVNEFARVAATLKQANLADRGVLISHAGFTADATLVAASAGIDLLTLDDLRQQSPPPAARTPITPAADHQEASTESTAPSTGTTSRYFVVMPFAPELDDVYHLGIRETIGELGGACERADEIHSTGGILEKIYDSIRRADVIVAEVSHPNPNVFYEVGYAHALAKPVILITRDIRSSPFDLRGYNHIVYSSIVDLRRRLGEMLRQIDRGASGRGRAG